MFTDILLTYSFGGELYNAVRLFVCLFVCLLACLLACLFVCFTGTPLTVYYVFLLSLSSLIYLALAEFGHLDLRQVVAIGLTFMVLGLLLTSLLNGALTVAISFGIIYGTGCGLVLVCTYSVIALWFPWSHKYHVFTTSSLSNMMPVGSVIVNNVSALMCSNPALGWRWAFRIYAVIISSLGILLLLVYGHPPKSSNEQRCCPLDERSDFLQKPPWTIGSKITIYGLWAMAICCKGFAFFLPFVILPKHVTDLGYKENEAEYVMTVLGITGLIGQMFSSFVGDYLKGKLMVVNVVAAALLAVNNIIAAYSTSLTGAFIYSAITGLAFGPYNAGYFAVFNEVMDGENVDTLFMTTRLSKGVGATTGPYLAGYIRDVTRSYYAVFLSIASCFGVFVLTTGVIIFINKWRNLKSIELMKNSILYE
ncbi:monocarboxylate transporter 13-like isoform X2 [Lingula anatina]|uniref:Monocarboxylate transporter 13-like isoform X2 n=1 Tax=Lingula anatina TaxID=7574 RepID=A0A1S3IDY3_LINAN|nr:monocarboxylate transporter 13-like isoform X2 [Lingula anatina]|eukprot:XP_013396368.1 monocarboxylate transporter 13-like isoform X2 [Lingula anatina]